MLHFIHKVSRVFFGKYWFSDLPITWLLIKWLACHMASRSQWRVAAIMTSLSWHHPIIMTSLIVPSPRWRILKTINIGENIPDFCHQFTHVRACITRSQDGWFVSAYSTYTPYIHTRCYLFLDVLYELLKVFLTIWPTLLHNGVNVKVT